MNTEKSPTDGGGFPSADARPGRHGRRRLSVATVAAAVLLAGGGGAYWASTAGEGGDYAPGSTSKPPKLALDGVAAQGGEGDGEGIAPGEPNPNAQTYRANKKMPDGPDTASVYRTPDGVSRAAVTALAESLDVSGKPEKKDGRWVVGKDGDSDGGLTLSVNDERMAGNWTYQTSRSPVMPCGKPLPTVPGGPAPSAGEVERPGSCPSMPDSGKGDPVSEKKAEDAVRPVLKTLKLQDAELDASVTTGPLRMVTVTPEVGGMPTKDWNTTFSVGKDGEIVRGHGNLGELSEGASYPVMSADETLKQLNKQGATGPHSGSGTVREPAPAPKADGKPGKGEAEAAKGKPLKVTDAEFGLVTRYSAGKPVLVPSWIYELELPGGDQQASVAHPAVEPEFLKPAKPQKPGGGSDADAPDGSGQPGKPGGKPGAETPLQAVKSYEVDGRTVKLTFWGGVCDKYTASAEESGKSVKVTVRPEKSDPDKVCVKMAKPQTVEVELEKELDGRKVVDTQDGEAVPKAR